MNLDERRQEPSERPQYGEESSLIRLLKIAALCSNARPDDEKKNGFAGDPTEVALLEAAVRNGVERHTLVKELVEEREVTFDSETMMMATFHRQPGEGGDGSRYYVAVKVSVMKKNEQSRFLF